LQVLEKYLRYSSFFLPVNILSYFLSFTRVAVLNNVPNFIYLITYAQANFRISLKTFESIIVYVGHLIFKKIILNSYLIILNLIDWTENFWFLSLTRYFDCSNEVLMTKNGAINFVHNFFPDSPWCKDMKSVEKMACSFDSAPEINFWSLTWALMEIFTQWQFKKKTARLNFFKLSWNDVQTALNIMASKKFGGSLTYQFFTSFHYFNVKLSRASLNGVSTSLNECVNTLI
jgi:hypothetical protein